MYTILNQWYEFKFGILSAVTNTVCFSNFSTPIFFLIQHLLQYQFIKQLDNYFNDASVQFIWVYGERCSVAVKTIKSPNTSFSDIHLHVISDAHVLLSVMNNISDGVHHYVIRYAWPL